MARKTNYYLTGARLYFSNGKTRNIVFTAKTTDLERIREIIKEIIKERHEAKEVRLFYEERI